MERTAAVPPAAERMTAGAPGLDLRGRTVLVASDDTTLANAVARVAASLERVQGAVPTVLHVFDLSAYPVPPLLTGVIGAADELLGEETHDEQRQAVSAHLAATVPAAARWPVRVIAGTPAVQIVSYAQRLGAALTVIGLRPHGRMDRIVRDETTLRVLRHTVSPVLAVVEEAHEVSRRIVVGIDFSRASVAAARAALDLAADGATLTLVHVEWPGESAIVEEGHAVVHELGVLGALARIQEYLGAQMPEARHIVIDTAIASGRPSEQLLDLAVKQGADLIAVASHQHGPVERLMLGCVTDELVRAAGRSLLVIPPVG